MGKVVIDSKPLMYPMPVVLVGANVGDRPNFMPVAWCGIVNGAPPMISVAIGYRQHTLKGIKESMAFSVNIPSTDMVTETDYCGLTHGSQADKTEVCRFEVFYGETEGAPLIEQCPLNMGCKVQHMLDLGSNWLIIGRIEETQVSESCLTDGKPDPGKIRPMAYAGTPKPQYLAPGEFLARAFSVGMELRAGEET
jgi:flavin reductase (DIM6/NTAB) family NADH-FMN oxidoreductase RutF